MPSSPGTFCSTGGKKFMVPWVTMARLAGNNHLADGHLRARNKVGAPMPLADFSDPTCAT
ncbi:MAG: hypothetical protein ABSG98_09595 [Anaerolineales bacterium]|jgi:hypothetical protein